jgi:hypothetical protein
VRTTTTTTPWPESASELYRPSDSRLSTKLVPTFADRGVPRHVVSVTDPYGRILGFLDLTIGVREHKRLTTADADETG